MKKYISATAAVLLSAMLAAQETAALSVAGPTSKDNSMIYLLAAIMAVLLLAIAILGKVFVSLTKMVINKQKEILSALAFILLAASTYAQEATPNTNTPVELSSKMFALDADVVIGTIVLLAEICTVFFLLFQINKLLNILSPKPKKEWNFHLPKAFDSFNKSVSIEQEGDIMLDHDYDGIKELDNDLPPWWKYGFYLTIVWAVAYLFYFHLGGGGKLSRDEYNNEMEVAKLAKEEFMRNAKNNVDENTVAFDAEMIAEGTNLFKANCAACHGNAGEGNVGPNLTDEYWLHGGSVKDVFKTIKYGWPNKGMKAWESDFSAVQMQAIASYIQSIHGSNPANAKAPQGEIYAAEGVAVKDSTIAPVLPADSAVVNAQAKQ